MNNRLFFTVLTCILCGLLSRFIPHPPNFTAVNALALWGFSILGNLNYAFFTLFITMFLSDLIFGFHSTLFYVYASLGLIVSLGYFAPTSLQRTWLLSALSSGLFFVITNVGEWLTNPLYTKNFLGLSLCFLAAVPFILNQLLGDLFYTSLIFASFKFIRSREVVRPSPLKVNTQA